MRTIRSLIFLFFAVFLLITEVFPQKNDIPIQVKTNIYVYDSNKQPVEDVKLEDIKIFEDGVEQKITYFSHKEPILNLAMAFDNSGSIRTKLDEIIKSGKIITANLRDNDEAFAVRFTGSDTIEVIQDFTNKKAEIAEAIGNIYISLGQSAVLDALYLSAEKLLEREKKDKSKRYAILLFSDVEERNSYYKFSDVLNLIKGSDLQIFTLSYANFAPESKKQSQKLSHLLSLETGGATFTLLPKYKDTDLIESLKSIIYELRSQYVIGYVSSNQLRNGKLRKLTVQIADSEKGEKRQFFIKDSFLVPKK